MNNHKIIAYWWDGYFISDNDAKEQAEVMDSMNAFGGEHKLMEVPAEATQAEMQRLVDLALLDR